MESWAKKMRYRTTDSHVALYNQNGSWLAALQNLNYKQLFWTEIWSFKFKIRIILKWCQRYSFINIVSKH